LPISQKARAGKNLKVVVSRGVGFCSGVKRAIKIALAAARRSEEGVYSLGPLIHNPQVVEKLKEVGVRPMMRLRRGGGSMVVRSHGASPKVLRRAADYGYSIIDATCPFVQKAQQNAHHLYREGYKVVIVGERDHPEVRGIRSHVEGKAAVIENAEQARKLERGARVGIVAQTTLPVDTFAEVVGAVTRRAREVLVFNTICSETARRQEHARDLARRVDVLMVVGGRNSANTTRLERLCSSICRKTHHVETADEIRSGWFRAGDTVGVVAGASTPGWLVESIVEKLEQL
jgi:4-hydroxy-3-methylbut-2-enyl diphosphate reductase